MAFKLTYTSHDHPTTRDPGDYADHTVATLDRHCTRAARWIKACETEANLRLGHGRAHIEVSPDQRPDSATWVLLEPFDPAPTVTDDEDESDEDESDDDEDEDGTGERTLMRFRVQLDGRQWRNPYLTVNVDLCSTIFGTGDPDPSTLDADALKDADRLGRQILDQVLTHILNGGPQRIASWANWRVIDGDSTEWAAAFHQELTAHHRNLTCS